MTRSMLKDHTDTLRKGYPAPEFELQTANGEKNRQQRSQGQKGGGVFPAGNLVTQQQKATDSVGVRLA